MEVLSTRNSQQTQINQQQQYQQRQQQQQQQERNVKFIETKQKQVMQLPIQTVSPIQPIVSIQPKPTALIPFRMNQEYLHTAQSLNSYQQQKLPPQTLYDLINRSNLPVKRRRRKSRRQRKVRNHLDESSHFRPDQLVSKNYHEMKSTLRPPNGSRNNVAYAISLSEKNKSSFNNSNDFNRANDFQVGTKSYKIWTPVKAENVLEAPFATSTSAGKTQIIIISSSRTTSTDRTGNVGQQQMKHRKETHKQRSPESARKQFNSQAPKRFDNKHVQLQNKYNIDYDNKLEDEFEIIMKEE